MGLPGDSRVPAPAATGFRSVLCLVDGSRGSAEAVAQALALVDPGGGVTFSAAPGCGPAAEAEVRAARQARVSATMLVRSGDQDDRDVVASAEGHDLLVVAAPVHGRAAGILLGSLASLAVHAAPVPVLVARLRPDVAFPGPVLAAAAGAQDAHVAMVAARIAAANATCVLIARAGNGDPTGKALDEPVRRVRAITGHVPAVLAGRGEAGARLAALAASTSAGLLVMGSRGRSGVDAIGSVSERVAHRAPCSVLVLRSQPQPAAGDPASGPLPDAMYCER